MSQPVRVHHTGATLAPDPRRVVARLFLPGEDPPMVRSRAGAVADRVLGLPEADVDRMADEIVAEFSARHRGLPATLARHAAAVSSHVPRGAAMSAARRIVLGASFTAEYAVEGAALCNPSAVEHPDQTGLEPGTLRVALSLRGIGEGHLSSLGFATAVVGPGATWTFQPRSRPAVAGVNTAAVWNAEHLRSVLADQGAIDQLADDVLDRLPAAFDATELNQVLADSQQAVLARPGGPATFALLRQLVDSAYEVAFPADVDLSQRVLLPSVAEESNGMEDARFVRFRAADGSVDYRATYTAYDGRRIAPRLLTSPDLRRFQAHRLSGPAARNKGMALFPRTIDDQHWALCRTDGESTALASSTDGFTWGDPQRVQAPEAPWEVLQVGNCGPPIETNQGWLVLTHGVGPMRTYAIGAMLLALEEPARVLRRLDRPLLQATPTERDGYVPNVVYSCGGLVHDGLLWLPYGIGDARIGVAWAALDDLLAAMTPTRAGHAPTRRS